ncbi:MAG: OmpH family outer membrane protein [Bacteroidales bacterium]
MKKITLFTLIALLSISTVSFAQEFKFGHINSQELIALMPERDSALVVLQKHENELQEELKGLHSELQAKYNIYQQKQASWTASILEAKTNELQEMDQRLQSFQQNASQELQQLQQVLFRPVLQKANNIVEKIGKERNLIYIFDTSGGTIPYISDSQSLDILPIAKERLGIPADKKPQQFDQNPL